MTKDLDLPESFRADGRGLCKGTGCKLLLVASYGARA
jgi:hypothetical protein